MAARIAQPWRSSPTMRPNRLVSAGADREDRQHLHEVRQRRRVLVGVRRVGVEEAAAVGAQHLDGELRGHRPLRDRLLAAFERRGRDIGGEVLRHALPDVEQRQHDAGGQQQVERAADQVGPEIADALGIGAREATHQRHREGDAGGGAREVLHRQPGHLRQIAQGLLAAVGLPVGVGDEADRGVERRGRAGTAAMPCGLNGRTPCSRCST